MNELSDHPLFFLLSGSLKAQAEHTLKTLHREWVYDSPNDMYDDVREQVREGCFLTGIEKTTDDELRRWADLTPSTEFIAALAQFFWRAPATSYTPPKATAAQLRILEEYQAERGMDMDFTPLFGMLTTNLADSIIKGLVVVSEVLRSTGQRRMHPRDVRLAIRQYLTENPDTINDRRPPKG